MLPERHPAAHDRHLADARTYAPGIDDLDPIDPVEPDGDFQPPSTRSGHGPHWRLVLAIMVLAAGSGAVGFGVGRTTAGGHKEAAAVSTAPTTVPSPTVPPTTTAPNAAPSSTTTASPTTTPPDTSPEPAVSSAGPAGAFAGHWRLHVTLMAIDPAGYGILSWRTYSTCGQDPPPCDIFSGNYIIDGGNATFALAATSPTTASGTVLTTTAPRQVPLGRFTARLDRVRDLIQVSFPLDGHLPLCGPSADAMPFAQQNALGINCGA
jgi:hypothetical protein